MCIYRLLNYYDVYHGKVSVALKKLMKDLNFCAPGILQLQNSSTDFQQSYIICVCFLLTQKALIRTIFKITITNAVNFPNLQTPTPFSWFNILSFFPWSFESMILKIFALNDELKKLKRSLFPLKILLFRIMEKNKSSWPKTRL